MRRPDLWQRCATAPPCVRPVEISSVQRPKSGTKAVACLCIGLLLALGTGVAQARSVPISRQATESGRAASVAGTSRVPAGLPPGWRVYKGTQVPFVIAYPPKWSVDETNSPVGEISFSRVTKTDSISGTIATRRTASSRLPLSVLRAQFVSFATRTCEQGRKLEGRGTATSATVRFATAIAECELVDEQAGHGRVTIIFYVGVTVKNGVQWTCLFRSSKEHFQANQRKYFTPMPNTFRQEGANTGKPLFRLPLHQCLWLSSGSGSTPPRDATMLAITQMSTGIIVEPIRNYWRLRFMNQPTRNELQLVVIGNKGPRHDTDA
jgi:hypothetical protein